MKRIFFLLLLCLCFTHCTRHTELTEQGRIERDITTLEKEAQFMDEKIKNLSSDRERQLQLTNERELLRSRIERLKAKRQLP